MSEPPLSSDPARQARLLLRAARSAALGTICADGLPAVSLVTPATTMDLSVLMLLSSLSEHRRNLERDASCALMVTGVAETPNPQTAPRLSLSGRASPVPAEEEAALRRRWLASHPYAEAYAGFADFALWRFMPERAHFVGGFAQAHRLGLQALRPPPEAIRAIADAEAALLAVCDPARAEALAIAAGGAAGPWRLAAIDPDGCDVVSEAVSLRFPFETMAATTEEAQAALLRSVP